MRVEEALRLFHLAETSGHDPDRCAAGRWTCHVLTGDFELAWRESRAIAERGNPDPQRFWDGQPLKGRSILMRCLHGLGDTIQFIRYAPLIREQARTLTIQAQPSLKLLLEQAGIAERVITWGEPEPEWDQQIEVVELPRIFGTTLNSIPSAVPYLNVPAAPVSNEKKINDKNGKNGLRVGIVWASGAYNRARSISLEKLSRLFTVPGVSFFSLQGGAERTELAAWTGKIPCLHDEYDEPLATARKLKSLDLVITVDTMMAHLAGSMARPVWTLLAFHCDWRWMLGREDSPWYPTMRLFRQPAPGDWDTALHRVKTELEILAAAKQR